MEIQVGDYVRTQDGYIAKLMQIQKSGDLHTRYIFDGFISDDIYEGESYLDIIKHETLIKYEFKNIIKHSKNIIDLIEVGDYVNGYRVVDIMEDMKTGEIHLEMTSDYTNEIIGDCTIYNDDIKSIVTHKQFSQVEYEV